MISFKPPSLHSNDQSTSSTEHSKKAITLPGAPEILTMIDENGKHHLQCDICGLVIILKEMHKYMTSFLDPSIKPPIGKNLRKNLNI